MPQPIYLPQKKNWWEPMMQQGSNFLWQLAIMKAQQKMSLEKIKTEAVYNAAMKAQEHEYKMEEKKAGPSKPVKGKEFYWIHDPVTNKMTRTEVPSPETAKAYQTWKLPGGQTVNLQTGVEPPPGAVKFSATQTEKVWMHNPKLKRKIQVSVTEIPQWEKRGFIRGQPYGAESTRDPILDLQRLSKEYKTPDSFMERIVLSPGKKKQNLNNWLIQRERLTKQGKYSRDELTNETMAIMADLGYPPQYHDTVAIMLTDPKVKVSEIMQFINEIKDEELMEPE